MGLNEALAVAQGHGGGVEMRLAEMGGVEVTTGECYRNGIDEAESWQYGVKTAGISRRARLVM